MLFLPFQVNPINLANVTVDIGGSTEQVMEINNKIYGVSTYECSDVSSTPCIFLPNKNGELRQGK